MTALIVIVAIIAYIAIGCMTDIVIVKSGFEMPEGDEFFEWMVAGILIWPIIVPLILAAYLLLRFERYLQKIRNK